MFLSLWRLRYIPNYARNFLLLRNNNKILLNLQLSKFMNISPECTFCSFFPLSTEIPHETIVHLFFDCTITKNCLNAYFNNFINDCHFCQKILFLKAFKTYVPVRTFISTSKFPQHYFTFTSQNKKRISLVILAQYVSPVRLRKICC